MYYFRFLILFLLFILASCSKDTAPSISEEIQKTPFFISIYNLQKDAFKSEVRKSWVISAKSSLTLTSKGVGEVYQIEVKEWSQIKAGSVIARLRDTLTNYDLQLEQAENTLKIQDASRATTIVNLDQSVENAKIAYERAKQTYDVLLDRNALQYDLAVSANKKTLDSYNESYRSYLTDLEKTYTQMLYEWDKILWITPVFETANDAWEGYIGARNGTTKNTAQNEWSAAGVFHQKLKDRINKSLEIDRVNSESDIMFVAQWYEQLRRYVDAMIDMFQSDIVASWLTQSQHDAWLLAWNGYRSSVGWSESGYNTWRAQTIIFFNNYKKTERATKLAVASLDRELTGVEKTEINSDPDLRITYENTRIDLSDKIKTAELALNQTKVAYDSAFAIRDATIGQLDTSRKSAEISLNLARRNADNLIVRAPVSGTITKLLTSVGQSVTAGSQIVELMSNEPEVVLDIESNLARALSVGKEVVITVDGKDYKWTITALSSVAWKNLLSTLRISVPWANSVIGKTASIIFYPDESIGITGSTTLIPLEAVHIVAENEWEIRYYSGGTIGTRTIRISSLRGSFIETPDNIESSLQIILTDTTNYDEMKNILQLQQ